MHKALSQQQRWISTDLDMTVLTAHGQLKELESGANLPGDRALVHLAGGTDRSLMFQPEIEIQKRKMLERKNHLPLYTCGTILGPEGAASPKPCSPRYKVTFLRSQPFQ